MDTTIQVELGDEFENEIKQFIKSTIRDNEDLVRQEDIQNFASEEDIEDFVKKSEINTAIDEALDELDLSDKITDITDDIDWADKIKDAVDDGDLLEHIDELVTKKVKELLFQSMDLQNIINKLVDQRFKESSQEKASLDHAYSTLQVSESTKAISKAFDDLRAVLFKEYKADHTQ
jgi:hypothetical protein